MTLIEKADAFAAGAHGAISQKRKFMKDDLGNEIDYIVHPREVASIVSSITDDENMIAAALLHDTIEDTKITKEMIKKEFNEIVAELVDELTKKTTLEDGNRKKRNALECMRLKNISEKGKTIKAADIYTNARDIAKWDKDFAPVYLMEKKNELQVLTGADERLLEMAKKLVDELIEDISASDSMSYGRKK